MSLLDFASREVVVHTVGGGRLVCRPPTVHTVAVFLQRFGLQAAALCEAVSRGFAVTPRELIEHLVSDSTRGDAVAVLSTCVTCDGASLGALGKSDIKLLRDLAEIAASLTDPARIIEVTGLASALDQTSTPADPAAADHDADAVCLVAAHFSVSPTAVLDWPYLAFLAAGEHLSRINKRTHEAANQQGGSEKYTVISDIPEAGMFFEKGD